jgi:hypothetical protein
MPKKDRRPIFVSFVKDGDLTSKIYDLVRLKETDGCIIAFDKDRNVLGVGFTAYSHILHGDEILNGKVDDLIKDQEDEEEEDTEEGYSEDEIRYKNNEEESFTFDELMEPFSGVQPSVEHMTLEDIKNALIDDPELTDNERFEIYYKNHQREKEEKK